MTKPKTASSFKQVSLPNFLYTEVKKAAELSGRSCAGELEHAFRISQGLEKLIPVQSIKALKQKNLTAQDILTLMIVHSDSPEYKASVKAVVDDNPVRISKDPNDPSLRILKTKNGDKESGKLDESGVFIENQ